MKVVDTRNRGAHNRKPVEPFRYHNCENCGQERGLDYCRKCGKDREEYLKKSGLMDGEKW